MNSGNVELNYNEEKVGKALASLRNARNDLKEHIFTGFKAAANAVGSISSFTNAGACKARVEQLAARTSTVSDKISDGISVITECKTVIDNFLSDNTWFADTMMTFTGFLQGGIMPGEIVVDGLLYDAAALFKLIGGSSNFLGFGTFSSKLVELGEYDFSGNLASGSYDYFERFSSIDRNSTQVQIAKYAGGITTTAATIILAPQTAPALIKLTFAAGAGHVMHETGIVSSKAPEEQDVTGTLPAPSEPPQETPGNYRDPGDYDYPGDVPVTSSPTTPSTQPTEPVTTPTTQAPPSEPFTPSTTSPTIDKPNYTPPTEDIAGEGMQLEDDTGTLERNEIDEPSDEIISISTTIKSKNTAENYKSKAAPVLGALGISAAAGIGAKVYMDSKANNTNDEDDEEYNEYENSEATANEWSNDEIEDTTDNDESYLMYDKKSLDNLEQGTSEI